MPESTKLLLDLHLHSDRSDGRHPPEEVLRRGLAGGLDLLALTDHDLPPALPAGQHGRLRVIEGVELSGSHEGREFHLLCWFPGAMPPAFVALLRARACARARRYDHAAVRLGLPPAEDAAHAGERALTRQHLARALHAAGRIRNVAEAWPLLGPEVVPPVDLSFRDAIRAAVGAGALTSWAHPSLADAQRYVAGFAAVGLHGLEADRPGLDRPTRNGLRRLAKAHRLLVTGGSDWHGWWAGSLGDYAFTGEHAAAVLARLGAG